MNSKTKYFPRTIFLNIIDTCNLECKHCIKDSSSSKLRFLEKDKVFYVIDELSKHKTSNIVLTGGEPLLHKDFWEIIDYSTKVLTKTYVDTNGTLLSKEIAQKIQRYPNCVIQISLDGLKSSHEYLRGKGTFDKTIKSIENLTDNGASPIIATTMHSSNYLEVEKMYRLLENLGVRSWRLMPLMKNGRAKSNFDALGIGVEEWRTILQTVKKLNGKLKVSAEAMFSFIGKSLPPLTLEKIETLGCEAGKFRASIQTDGTVTPCSMLPDYNCGNIFNQRFIDLWENAKNFKKFRNFNYKNVMGCSFCQYLEYCKGGCHGTALNETGSIYNSDPRCPIIPK